MNGLRPVAALFLLVVACTMAPAGCSSDRSGGAATGSTAATTVPRCASTQPLASGRHSFRSGGVERSFLLDVPNTIAAPTPLVVALHGFNGSGAELEASTELGARGTADGVVVVAPDAMGSPARWNFDRRSTGPDDYAFIAELVDHLTEQGCIDSDRTFVAGSSNGAAFAGLLACAEPHRFAAVAMVIATVPAACAGPISPSIITIRGSADPHVAFAGTPEAVAADARRYRCGDSVSERPSPSVDRTRYVDCQDGTEIVLDAVRGGGHRWPGGADVDPALGGYDATDEILGFFAAHPARS